jgi:hypothetical protein
MRLNAVRAAICDFFLRDLSLVAGQSHKRLQWWVGVELPSSSDLENRPRDVGGKVGGEKNRRPSDLAWFAGPPHRYFSEVRVPRAS